jgi:hypothetical protein
MQPVLSEINNAAPVPGRDPMVMLKNGEPMPQSGILLKVNIDNNRKAANVVCSQGSMKWENYKGDVHVGFGATEKQDPSSVHVLYTATDHTEHDLKPSSRGGAAYDGMGLDQFENHSLSQGDVLVSRDPLSVPADVGIRYPTGLYDPKTYKGILRVYDSGDINGATQAVKIVMESMVGLPITDSAKIAEEFLKKMKLTKK